MITPARSPSCMVAGCFRAGSRMRHARCSGLRRRAPECLVRPLRCQLRGRQRDARPRPVQDVPRSAVPRQSAGGGRVRWLQQRLLGRRGVPVGVPVLRPGRLHRTRPAGRRQGREGLGTEPIPVVLDRRLAANPTGRRPSEGLLGSRRRARAARRRQERARPRTARAERACTRRACARRCGDPLRRVLAEPALPRRIPAGLLAIPPLVVGSCRQGRQAMQADA